MAAEVLLNGMLAKVDMAYQNLESVELGVTTVDHYFDTLGGISRSVRRAKGGDDLFSQLCHATHEDGALLSNQDIIDHMSFLMMAAHDTLTSSLTSFVSELAAHADWQRRLRDEVLGLGQGRAAQQVVLAAIVALPSLEGRLQQGVLLEVAGIALDEAVRAFPAAQHGLVGEAPPMRPGAGTAIAAIAARR